MVRKKLTKKMILAGPVLAALIGAGVVLGCTNDTGIVDGRDSGNGVVATQEISERGSGESGGEHGPGGEGAGGESGSTPGSEEASGANLAPDETFDAVRGGARLILNYDAAGNAFTGTVENTTGNVLGNVRIEVHLSNGTELGPTTLVDLAPGQVMDVNLPSTAASFTDWIAHAEVGSGAEGGQAGGEGGESESGPDGPEGTEGVGAGNEAAMEAAMSSPIIPLDQTWNGVLGGLAISATYDAATKSVNSTVQNTTSQTLCYVQAEPHLKSGTQTVGELGPDVLGDLNPGQQAISSVSVDTEPSLAGVAFDGYVVHMEVFDCGGPGPQPHTGGEGSEGPGGEGHGPGGEGSSESGGESNDSGSEEGSGATLALDETYDAVRGGTRLILNYDVASNAFTGTVENITGNVLSNVRIEVHLSNGTELGPTTPVDMAPGEMLGVNLPATAASFTAWVAHAEVGGGEGGGEHGSGGGEGGGEHGSGGERRGGG
ncbi:MAG: FxLYD domain-containing protein [Gammaproteobacteria bacterium]|nr:FxLYD domain-containing protein [Gammaproteobacteria bacterium]